MTDPLSSDPKVDCCSAWLIAYSKLGTDNESYGYLLRDYNALGPKRISDNPEWYMGTDLPRVNFCPWCGAKKS